MPARPGRSSRLAAGTVSALAILVVGVWLGGHPGWIPSGIRGTFSNEGRTGQFVQSVLNTVHANFYRKVSVTKLANAGLGAALASLGDPYTHYYSPSEYRAFQNESNPRVRGGIGVDVQANRRGVLITSVFPSSPAARAGLQAGEVITGVGSKPLAGRSPFYASSLITGKPGTQVALVLLDNGRRRMLRLVRETVNFVAGSGLLHYRGVTIGKLVFNHFSDGSGALLRVQVDKVLHQGARALILDLRGNGGGLLQEAVNVASIFIPDGTIVSTHGRTQPRQVYVARGGAISSGVPLVVLVDGTTASSSEIVTAALQDRGRAKVVGTHTYGKGVYQEIQTLPNGGALELTVGEFFTPNGRNLGGGGDKRGAGVTPNVYVVPGTNANVDRQLQVAERVGASEVR
jgi:carboxyl-terminal processing protease